MTSLPAHQHQREIRMVPTFHHAALPHAAHHGGELITRKDTRFLVVDVTRQHDPVHSLIDRMYGARGMPSTLPPTALAGRQRITVAAMRGDTTFGTVTLSLDSGHGLLADDLYRNEIDVLRRQNARVCELTRLAVDPQHNSKEVLAGLFHLAYIFGRLIHHKTDVVIEVNPRHVGYYRRMVGFDAIGEQRICRRVSAPAVLMHLKLAHVDEQIARLHQGDNEIEVNGERSIYPHFFSAREQGRVLWRLLKGRKVTPAHTDRPLFGHRREAVAPTRLQALMA